MNSLENKTKSEEIPGGEENKEEEKKKKKRCLLKHLFPADNQTATKLSRKRGFCSPLIKKARREMDASCPMMNA